MIKRWQEKVLREEIGTRRGVHLTGARQCGKTTLAEFVAQNEMRHLTLDDDRILKAAKDDPHSFVDRRDGRTSPQVSACSPAGEAVWRLPFRLCLRLQ